MAKNRFASKKTIPPAIQEYMLSSAGDQHQHQQQSQQANVSARGAGVGKALEDKWAALVDLHNKYAVNSSETIKPASPLKSKLSMKSSKSGSHVQNVKTLSRHHIRLWDYPSYKDTGSSPHNWNSSLVKMKS